MFIGIHDVSASTHVIFCQNNDIQAA